MPDKLFWYQISLYYGTGGIAADEKGVIHETAPLFRWMIGKTLDYVTPWISKRKGWIQALPESEE
jgi:hypothetical protein